MNRKIRKNGFSRPLNFYQVSSWLIILFSTIGCIVTVLPFFPIVKSVIHMKVIFFVLILIFLSLTIYFWVRVSIIAHSNTMPENNCSEVTCNYCFKNVHVSCKHCKICNKCVMNFDHHCTVLNTCIGKENYRYFISLLISSFLLHIIFLYLMLNQIIMYYINYQSFVSETNEIGKRMNAKIVIFFDIGLICVNLIILGVCLFMILLHLILKCQKLTTYQFILQKRNKAKIESLEIPKIGEHTDNDSVKIRHSS